MGIQVESDKITIQTILLDHKSSSYSQFIANYDNFAEYSLFRHTHMFATRSPHCARSPKKWRAILRESQPPCPSRVNSVTWNVTRESKSFRRHRRSGKALLFQVVSAKGCPGGRQVRAAQDREKGRKS